MRQHKGLTFSDGTPHGAQIALARAIRSRARIRVFYGWVESGYDWAEEHETIGYAVKLGSTPALLYNKRSRFYHMILTGCIVKIAATSGGEILYQHPAYKAPEYQIDEIVIDGTEWSKNLLEKGYRAAVTRRNDEAGPCNVANFRTRQQAERWTRFMRGERMAP